ncbi:MAG: TM2 domain-containing protein [Flavobacteriales bacterium]|nr:TM2 domain-containing protein [Flavobacteriales bacterium]MBK6944622.1 TM2 domain-containing protein [Flavobacteriales bacterium]MBK7241228.1 TM2 domain-containing protein [Flavobacteriales bacterium]MBK7295610.1 TM2 domain-containing protein [Flavobacteriales bacterium]MBK9534276.1 TM2 domain-containing protein [Flavobacteriales bacterium]
MLRYILLILSLITVGSSVRASGPYRAMNAVELNLLDSLTEQYDLSIEDGPKKENARLISSSLAVLLGPFGAHRLYLGTTTKVAIIYGITFGGFGILATIDLFHLLFTKDLDAYRNSDKVFMWVK